MKFLIVLASVVAIAVAQRPTYAGLSSKGYPELASRFRDPADDQDDNAVNSVVVNRLGVDTDQPPQNLPTDARGDVLLVNRLNQWPQENRPFWLINAKHIENHRHPNENLNRQQQVLNTNQQGTQQRFNEIQPNSNQQGLNRQQQTFGVNQQPVVDLQPNRGQDGQAQSRLGESVGTETRTIKPLSSRGSFAGERT